MVGGVGEREGGTGTFNEAFGAGNLESKTGAGTERLFMVRRPRPSGVRCSLEGKGGFCL